MFNSQESTTCCVFFTCKDSHLSQSVNTMQVEILYICQTAGNCRNLYLQESASLDEVAISEQRKRVHSHGGRALQPLSRVRIDTNLHLCSRMTAQKCTTMQTKHMAQSRALCVLCGIA